MPTKVGEFEVLAEIAASKRGRIYKVLEPITQRTVALRVLDSTTPNFANLQTSLRAAAKLSSPNIVAVHEVRDENGSLIVMMEYVEGRLLRVLMSQEGTFGRGDLVDFTRQAGMAIDHATSRGVVHTNLHPANIMQEWDGALKVMDYGLGINPHTLEALRYISPEQATGQKIDHRSNLYSWAAILYEAATGKKVFEGETADAILANIRTGTFIPPQQAKPDLHPGICAVISRALSLKPEDRYQSGAELVNALESCTRPAAPKVVVEPPAKAVQPKVPEFTVAPAPAQVRPLDRPIAPTPVAKPQTPAAPARPVAVPPPKPITGAPAAAAATLAPAVPAKPKAEPETPKKDFFVIESKATVAPAAPQQARTPAPRPAPRKPATSPDPLALFKSKNVIIGAIALLSIALLVIGVSLYRHRAAELVPPAPVAQTTTPEPVASVPEVTEQVDAPEPPEEVGQTIAAPRSRKNKKVAASLAAPVVTTGEIIVESSPNGAAVQIDGRSIGVTPVAVSQVSPGKHLITISLANHQQSVQSVDVSAGGQSRVAVQLSEMPATVAISSIPAGASILINGKDTGKSTPATLQLSRGHYSLELRKQGFVEANSVFDAAAGENVRLSPQLIAMGNADEMKEGGKLKRLFGKGGTDGMTKVRIRTNPKGAQIEFNQRRLSKNSPTEVFLPPGVYDVRITLPGYQTIQKRITVSTTEINLDETLQ